MRLSAVILAGSRSTRMGRDKAWLGHRGRPMIRAALDRVASLGIDEIYISAREDQDYSVLDCPVLFDREPGAGPLAGVERALSVSAAPLVLVLPVDLPRMTAGFLRRLARRCDRLTGAVAVLAGRLQPLVAVYPTRCHTYAALNLARGDYAVRRFAEACLHERAVRPVRVAARDAACFLNCNTPAEFGRA